jgi:hypothetical protein
LAQALHSLLVAGPQALCFREARLQLAKMVRFCSLDLILLSTLFLLEPVHDEV